MQYLATRCQLGIPILTRVSTRATFEWFFVIVCASVVLPLREAAAIIWGSISIRHILTFIKSYMSPWGPVYVFCTPQRSSYVRYLPVLFSWTHIFIKGICAVLLAQSRNWVSSIWLFLKYNGRQGPSNIPYRRLWSISAVQAPRARCIGGACGSRVGVPFPVGQQCTFRIAVEL